TVSVHCNTRSEQVMICLRYFAIFLVSLSIPCLAALFLSCFYLLSFQKTYPCKPGGGALPFQEAPVSCFRFCTCAPKNVSQDIFTHLFRIFVHMEARSAGRRTYPRACSEAHLWQ